MKTINKRMSYNNIYEIAVNFMNHFKDTNEKYMPAAVAYSIQKNRKLFLDIATEIEEMRLKILNHYNTSEDPGLIQVDPDLVDTVNKELEDLLNIEEDLKIYTFKIDEISDIQFTPLQIETLMFMIDED